MKERIKSKWNWTNPGFWNLPAKNYLTARISRERKDSDPRGKGTAGEESFIGHS